MLVFSLVMIVVIALVVGPILMMRPSPAQRNKEQLRSLAAAKGISFSIKNLPQQAGELEAPAPIPVYFYPPASDSETDWLLLRANYPHEIHFLQRWAWQGDVRASQGEQQLLERQLPLLHESVMAVSAGSKGICVFWREKGGEPALEQIMSLLEALKKLQQAQG
ncbi:MAG TPA: hypothetical protein VN030_14725 [Cellvibrio sp.]|nr:hypothetical protein [Cellvibrio sp.]